MSVERTDITELLTKASLMSISTVGSAGRPQAAVVGFVATPEFEMIFRTQQTSRKYANLQYSPQVALVVWDGLVTVQYEGVAQELLAADVPAAKVLYFKKHPYLKKSENAPGFSFFKISPQWIRYTSLTTQPWTVKEFTF